MRILCLGGGAAGLYFAISAKLRDPSHDITVIERNPAGSAYGWGVVLSDEVMDVLRANDRISAADITGKLVHWDNIAVVRNGRRDVSGGHGFSGLGRAALLSILQRRAQGLGVTIRYENEFSDADGFRHDYDVIVAADGLNSSIRDKGALHFAPGLDRGLCRYVWLGTKARFDDAFTFIFEETVHGPIWAHVYQFDEETATFIIETLPETWEAAGFGQMSKPEMLASCREIFANHLGGHGLLCNADHLDASQIWSSFPRLLCRKWYDGNVVLLGDAAATAHFSIGSGTRMALEGAIALADALHGCGTVQQAFAQYEEQRRTEVLRLQSAARNSAQWFEDCGRYKQLHPLQFTYSLLTRSQRISHENLRLRDADWLRRSEDWFQEQAGGQPGRAPVFAPFRLRGMQLCNRIAMSPMAQYKAVDGVVGDWHLVHYGERAKGGAGLIFTEMTSISPEGRITPGCPGLYDAQQEAGWRRIVDFVHRETSAKICCQLGHSGRKGSTRRGWEGIDTPLAEGNWPLLSASALPWDEGSQIPAAATRADMDLLCHGFRSAALRADAAGFDMLELHAAHGYLLGSFISPLSNLREDDYGGDLAGRLRFPLEVLAAIREVWPEEKPVSVRISAHDWAGDAGTTPRDAVAIAKAFHDAGADIIDVSAGQSWAGGRPEYGRMFQTPFSDRIRNEAGIPTMAVGNIQNEDHANSILMAGRADLVCIGRPHLADPYWTLNAAMRLGDQAAQWPLPYLSGAEQAWRLHGRKVDHGRS